MKILWFTNSEVDFYNKTKGYNGGGWMLSLKKELDSINKVELGISFILKKSYFKKKIANTTYYPVEIKFSLFENILMKVLYWVNFIKYQNKLDNKYLQKYLDIIQDFNPSVIHIWGTEKNFGLICKHTKIPVVIHLQGILNPYLNALLPPSISLSNYIFKNGIKPLAILRNRKELQIWEFISNREKNIFKNCKYYMGRTDWDKILTNIYSINSKYFHCDEMLRKEFYLPDKWEKKYNEKFKIISVISTPLYKGGELILKTALLLKNNFNFNFEWCVFGVDNLNFQEKLTGIKSSDINLKICGVTTAEDLRSQLLSSDVFVHPSYIDNSPNSLCEAQILGVPTIACNVGGISSLIDNNATGILVPSNDPFSLAYRIKEICISNFISSQISKKSIEVATIRHDSNLIIDNLYKAYKYIYEN